MRRGAKKRNRREFVASKVGGRAIVWLRVPVVPVRQHGCKRWLPANRSRTVVFSIPAEAKPVPHQSSRDCAAPARESARRCRRGKSAGNELVRLVRCPIQWQASLERAGCCRRQHG